MPELFHRLPRNVVAIFSGRNLLWQALAILLTIVIVMSGFDWTYFRWTRGDAFVRLARPAIIIGTFLPLTAILILLLVGAITKNRRFITTAWALGEAALLGYLISCGYKTFTGRLPPPFHGFRMSAMNEGSLVAGALLYAFYIGLGVSVTIHWFSEFVAGAITGSVVGIVVGGGFIPSASR
jgi:hypothetical protein